MHLLEATEEEARYHVRETFRQAASVVELSDAANAFLSLQCERTVYRQSAGRLPFDGRGGWYVTDLLKRMVEGNVPAHERITAATWLTVYASIFYQNIWARQPSAPGTDYFVSAAANLFADALPDRALGDEIAEGLAAFVLALREHPRNLQWKGHGLAMISEERDRHWLEKRSPFETDTILTRYWRIRTWDVPTNIFVTGN